MAFKLQSGASTWGTNWRSICDDWGSDLFAVGQECYALCVNVSCLHTLNNCYINNIRDVTKVLRLLQTTLKSSIVWGHKQIFLNLKTIRSRVLSMTFRRIFKISSMYNLLACSLMPSPWPPRLRIKLTRSACGLLFVVLLGTNLLLLDLPVLTRVRLWRVTTKSTPTKSTDEPAKSFPPLKPFDSITKRGPNPYIRSTLGKCFRCGQVGHLSNFCSQWRALTLIDDDNIT